MYIFLKKINVCTQMLQLIVCNRQKMEFMLPKIPLARFSEGHCFVCLNIYLGIYVLNPLVPSILNIELLAKILILIWDGITKKNFYERRAYESVDEQSYLKLCHETRREKESGHEWVNIYLSINVCVCVCYAIQNKYRTLMMSYICI